jgi:dolichol-phosphate mannosyltransferase
MDLSVVVPIHNEVENIEPLHVELDGVLRSLNLAYEVVYVDDGSDDGSFEILSRLAAGYPEVVVVRLRGRRGWRIRAVPTSLRWTATAKTTPPTSRPSW